MDFDAGPYRTLSCITQNVDGFHAATGSTSVIDLHGDLNELVCTQCDFRERVEDQQPVVLPPRCPRCEAVLRPDVVLFGEMLPAAKTERLYHELRSGFDAVFSIGTSSAFHYVAWPIQLAQETLRSTLARRKCLSSSMSEYHCVPVPHWTRYGLATRTVGNKATPHTLPSEDVPPGTFAR
jgi:NAD-dependent deacetylase